MIEVLAGQWHVYAPDLRGHGLSGHVPGRYHLLDYVEDITAFLERVVQKPAVLYGHSLGGEVAIMLEGYDPEILHPAISCPVLLLQADPAAGGALSDQEVPRGMRLLAHPVHVRLDGIGHELHGPPGQEQRVLQAIAPFLEAVRSSPHLPATGQESAGGTARAAREGA